MWKSGKKKKALHMLIINVSTDLPRESNEGYDYHVHSPFSTFGIRNT